MTLATTPALSETWRLETGYDLPRRAAVKAPKAPKTYDDGTIIQTALPLGPMLFGNAASHSQILSPDVVSGDFTAELWIVDHVNQPVGAVMSVGATRLGYYNGTAIFGADQALQSANIGDKAFKERWHHLALVRAGQRLSLYHNGVKISDAAAASAAGPVRLDSYLKHEPYMIPANLVHTAALERRALSASEIATNFNAQSQLVEDGRLYADRFHFTQPPYLNTPQTESIELSFEFDHDATAQVAYGETEDTLKVVNLTGSSRLHGVKLDGLKPDTPYFYRVTGTDAKGAKLDSGLLSFRSAPLPGRPFVMIVSGDTEARPHINNRMSELMWEERPALLAIMGDLTDGGSKDKRFEWTHEYFTGMGPFFGRVPTLGVVGNGEEDLHWYRHYHRQNMASPARESYFSMVYGDVEFFVLDANLERREREAPGFRARQKAWLDQALKNSKARWKIAMHHQDVRTSDNDDYGDSFREKSTEGDRDIQADFLPLYEKHTIDLVFFGHLHSYERSWPVRGHKVDVKNGITYVQAGGLGGNLEDFAPSKPWFSAKTVRAHHYVALSITPDVIEGRMVDSEGRLRDVFHVHHRNSK